MTPITRAFATVAPRQAKAALAAIVAAMCCLLAQPTRAANISLEGDRPTIATPAVRPGAPSFLPSSIPDPLFHPLITERPLTPRVSSKISKHRSESSTVNAVAFRGEITAGDAADLQLYISRLPPRPRTIVYLNSPGGLLLEGLKLGKYFHDARIETVVDSEALCASACAWAFMGGRNNLGNPYRVKHARGRLGFHCFSIDVSENKVYRAKDLKEIATTTQQIILIIAQYLRSVGADLALVPISLQATPDEINLVSNADARKYGITVLDELESLYFPSPTPRWGSSAASYLDDSDDLLPWRR